MNVDEQQLIELCMLVGNYAMIAVLLGCGLRRAKLATVTLEHLQQRVSRNTAGCREVRRRTP